MHSLIRKRFWGLELASLKWFEIVPVGLGCSHASARIKSGRGLPHSMTLRDAVKRTNFRRFWSAAVLLPLSSLARTFEIQRCIERCIRSESRSNSSTLRGKRRVGGHVQGDERQNGRLGQAGYLPSAERFSLSRRNCSNWARACSEVTRG